MKKIIKFFLLILICIFNNIIFINLISCNKNNFNKNISYYVKKNHNIHLNIINKLNKYTEITPLIINENNYQNLQSKTIISELIINLSIIYKTKYKLIEKSQTFININVINNLIKNGEIIINLLFNNQLIKNPITNNFDFKIYFITHNLQSIVNIKNIFENEQNNKYYINNLIINLPNLGKIELGTLLTIVTQFLTFNKLPTIIPITYENNNQNWVMWNEWINFIDEKIKSFINQNLLDININEIFIINNQNNIFKTKINIQLNIHQLINSLSQDIIHIHNYIIQQDKRGQKNLILNLIKYFLNPINYSDFIMNDNYNKTISNNYILNINSNLENLIVNLLKTTQNAQTKEKYINNAALNIQLNINFISIFVKWYILQFIGINEKIKTFLNSLINHHLTKDIDIIFTMFKIFSIPIPFFFNNILFPQLLLQSEIWDNDININKYQIKQGYLTIQYTIDENTWYNATNIDDLLKNNTKNIQLVINNLIINITSVQNENITFITQEKNIFFQLDISNNLLSK